MPARFPRRLLIDKVNVERTSGTQVDERGIEDNSWSTVSTNVACRLTLISETENRDGRNTVVKSFNCVMPGDVDIKASDRIFENSTSRYFEVEAISEGRKMDGGVYYKSLSLLHRE
jgi:hypothetical protein|tara:strand:+ start:209 stop:556 length:348 start_codon:yes stop_codon:yes gene_type:complete